MTKGVNIFFGTFGLLTLALVAFLPVFNAGVDQYRVLGRHYESQYEGVEPNKAFLRTAWLLEQDPDAHPCLFFGSSRVGLMDTSGLAGGCFNYTHSKGTPHSYLHHLRLLLARGMSVDRMFVGLGEVSYTMDPHQLQNDYLRRYHPDGLLDWLDFLRFYAFKKPGKRDWDVVRGDLSLKATSDILDHRAWVHEFRGIAAQRAGTPEEHRRQMARESGWYFIEKRRVDETLSEVRALRDLAAEHGIETVWFVNPIHYKTLLGVDYGLFAGFKRSLSGIVPFHDFSGLTPEYTEDRYWLETLHYNSELGDRLVEKLGSGVPPVTSDTVEQVLATQRESLLSLLPDLVRKEGILLIQGDLGSEIFQGAPGPGSQLTIQAGLDVDRVQPRGGGMTLRALTGSPVLVLAAQEAEASAVFLLRIDVHAPAPTQMELSRETDWREREPLSRGQTLDVSPEGRGIYAAVSGRVLSGGLRLVPGQVPGIYEVGPVVLREMPLHGE